MTHPDLTGSFETERPRLLRLASRVLSDPIEAEDMVQQAWLRLERQNETPTDLAAWLTTVTTRLCLDRLRAKKPDLDGDLGEARMHPGMAGLGSDDTTGDPVQDAILAETVGAAMSIVLDRLSPNERVAFVLHDTFGFSFGTIATILDTSPSAARKLASRARAKIGQPSPEDALADWEIVDAFLTAARRGEFERLMELLAPQVTVRADATAIAMGTPTRMDGADQVAAFFDGAAGAARPVTVDGRAAAGWIHHGAIKMLFDFMIEDGRIASITFRAEPTLLARAVRRSGLE